MGRRLVKATQTAGEKRMFPVAVPSMTVRWSVPPQQDQKNSTKADAISTDGSIWMRITRRVPKS